MPKNKLSHAFTIVEMMIVIVIIGLLAGMGIAAYNGAQARARDAIRRGDLAKIAEALEIYNSDYGNYVETGSGCGYSGNGSGWFAYTDGGSYARSIADCLKDNGHLAGNAQDPLGPDYGSTPTNSNYTYMKYHCGSGATKRAFVYAKLETLPQSSTATDGTCSSSLDTSYGMNYYVEAK